MKDFKYVFYDEKLKYLLLISYIIFISVKLWNCLNSARKSS